MSEYNTDGMDFLQHLREMFVGKVVIVHTDPVAAQLTEEAFANSFVGVLESVTTFGLVLNHAMITGAMTRSYVMIDKLVSISEVDTTPRDENREKPPCQKDCNA